MVTVTTVLRNLQCMISMIYCIQKLRIFEDSHSQSLRGFEGDPQKFSNFEVRMRAMVLRLRVKFWELESQFEEFSKIFEVFWGILENSQKSFRFFEKFSKILKNSRKLSKILKNLWGFLRWEFWENFFLFLKNPQNSRWEWGHCFWGWGPKFRGENEGLLWGFFEGHPQKPSKIEGGMRATFSRIFPTLVGRWLIKCLCLSMWGR